MIKHSGHLRTLEKCRKHSPAARVFYISLVFSDDRRVLSESNTRLRLLYLLSKSNSFKSPTVLKTVGNIAKKAIKAREIDVRITWVSNYRCAVTKRPNWIPVIVHPRDRASIYEANSRAESQS